MEDDYDDDDLYYDDDYLYVEDSFAAADELAETSVPSPPTYDRIDDDYEGYDYYDYWMDVEYGTDEYYDLKITPTVEARCQAGQKRKLEQESDTVRPQKKSKTASSNGTRNKSENCATEIAAIWRGPNVVYRTSVQAHEQHMIRRDDRKTDKYALLPDWRDKYPEMKNTGSHNKADESVPLQSPSKVAESQRATGSQVQDAEDDRGGAKEPGLDPGVLLSVLQRKLAESGMGGDGAALQEMLAQMLSSGGGGGDIEEMLEMLTTSVLEQVDEGGAESGMGKWLSQQGVNMAVEQGEDEDGESDEEASDTKRDSHVNDTSPKSHDHATEEAPNANAAPRSITSQSNGLANREKPQDKPATAASKRQRKQKPTAKDLTVESTESEKVPSPAVQSTRGTKRKATNEEEDHGAKKQPRGGYAAATKSSQNRTEDTGKRTTRATRQRK